MHLNHPKHLRKQALAIAMTAAFGAAGYVGTASSDTYVFSFAKTTAAFTMLNGGGGITYNSNVHDCYDAANTISTNQCARTGITGSITYNTATKNGTMAITPFSFFGSGLASATIINFSAVGNGFGGPGSLLLGNMGFNWAFNYGIPVSIVWDATGMFNAINAGLNNGNTITGTGTSGATPESSNTGGASPIGKAVLATISFDTTAIGTVSLGTNPSGALPLIVDTIVDVSNGDTGIGGSPMATAPFKGYNANFDFMSLTVTSFTDTTPPVITLSGANPQTITQGNSYTELGATCVDAHDGSRTPTIDSSAVNTSVAGSYTVTYDCKDASNNSATQVSRTVNVVGNQTPSITLLGTTPVTHECHTTYTDAGATASDPQDGNITSSIVTTNGVNANAVGSYTVTYNVTDSNSNPAPTVTRTVNVVDTTSPVVTISGSNPLILQNNESGSYVAPTATATDSCDGPLPASTSNTPDFNVVPGQDSKASSLLYSATDSHGNTGTATRNVIVERAEPVITLVGNTNIAIASGATFSDPGVTVHDVQEGDATYTGAGVRTGAFPGAITITSVNGAVTGGNLNGTAPANGTYTIRYNVSDTDGNPAAQVTRTLKVGALYTAVRSNFTMIDPGGTFVDGASDIQATWDLGTYSETTLPENLANAGKNLPEIPSANMDLATVTPTLFSSYPWIAHDVHVVRPGTYSIETCPKPLKSVALGIAADDSTNCTLKGQPKNTIMTVTVPTGMIGAHMLFDWGQQDLTPGRACTFANCNIDVFVVWAPNSIFPGSPNDQSTDLCAKGTVWDYASIDPDNDGKPGVGMLDGAFGQFNANFNLSASPLCSPTGQETVVQNSGSPSSLGGGSADLWTLGGLLTWLMAGIRRKKR